MQNLTLVKSGEVARAAGVAVVDRTELPWPQRAAAIKIIDKATLDLATEERTAAKDLIEEAHRRHDPTCSSAHQTWQLALSERKKDIDPLEKAVSILDLAIKAWSSAEALRVAQEQRRLEEEARQKQLEEREEVIVHAETMGASPVEVQSLIEAPIPAPVVYERPAPAVKPQGAIVKEAWKGEHTDLWAFVQFAVLGAEPPPEVLEWVRKHSRRELVSLLASDRPAVNSFARSTKNAAAIPGLRIWDDGAVASSPRKV
jgi:hypothetical protein